MFLYHKPNYNKQLIYCNTQPYLYAFCTNGQFQKMLEKTSPTEDKKATDIQQIKYRMLVIIICKFEVNIINYLIILLMINSLIHQRVPLSKLILDQQPSPFKRKAKIFSRKLPQDFFHLRKSPLQTQRSITTTNRNYIQTQNYNRKVPQTERTSQTRDTNLRKGDDSGRTLKEQSNTMNLFLGIISSTRQIKKSIRKHSLQMKKEPQFNSNIENMRVELPPLFLKKGITLNF